MSALEKDFEISATGRRGFNTHEDIGVTERRDRDRLHGNVTRTIE
jgi:hypothetical protein